MSFDRITNPPALTRPATDHAGLLSLARELAARLVREERQTLATAIELGGVLNRIHPLTPYGQWGKLLDGLGLDRKSAWRYMQVAGCGTCHNCGSITEALDAIRATRPGPSEDADVPPPGEADHAGRPPEICDPDPEHAPHQPHPYEEPAAEDEGAPPDTEVSRRRTAESRGRLPEPSTHPVESIRRLLIRASKEASALANDAINDPAYRDDPSLRNFITHCTHAGLMERWDKTEDGRRTIGRFRHHRAVVVAAKLAMLRTRPLGKDALLREIDKAMHADPPSNRPAKRAG